MESKSTKDKKFDSIYRAYKDSIFKVAMHYAKCEDLANEITQKTFFQLYIYFENVNLDNVYIKTTEYGMMQLHKCIVLENRNKRQQNN